MTRCDFSFSPSTFSVRFDGVRNKCLCPAIIVGRTVIVFLLLFCACLRRKIERQRSGVSSTDRDKCAQTKLPPDSNHTERTHIAAVVFPTVLECVRMELTLARQEYHLHGKTKMSVYGAYGWKR